MSFPRYPKYKDSGVDWLGQVPAHWEVTALKRGFSVTLGKMLQPESSDPDDELQSYLRAANIQWEGVETTDIKHERPTSPPSLTSKSPSSKRSWIRSRLDSHICFMSVVSTPSH